MTIFRVVQVEKSCVINDGRWAVERTEPEGNRIVVTRHYLNQHDAEIEAERLNYQVAQRTMS